MKILVVDDDIFFLKVTEDLLDEAGHEVLTARSGATALSLAAEAEPRPAPPATGKMMSQPWSKKSSATARPAS